MSAVIVNRLRLQPSSATLSPWQADTLLGHLCWEAYFAGGDKELEDFLAPFRAGKPPFVLSDGFPGETFPRPLLPPPERVRGSKTEREDAMDQAKQAKKIARLTQAQFEQILRGESPAPDVDDISATVNVTLKNQINRLTGTTRGAEEDADDGNLYAVKEYMVYRKDGRVRVPVPITIYFWAESDAAAQDLEERFRSLARGGYGKKKSAGYGRFEVHGRDAITLHVPDDANGIVALANFVPAVGDPREGYYKTRVKYGKLGEAAILAGKALSPFKFPLVMLTAGSTFYSARRDFIGRLVAPIHPDDPRIVQGAFAPVLPIKLGALG